MLYTPNSAKWHDVCRIGLKGSTVITSFFTQGPGLDDAGLRKLILTFEKKVYKNQEMRIKFPDMPEK